MGKGLLCSIRVNYLIFTLMLKSGAPKFSQNDIHITFFVLVCSFMYLKQFFFSLKTRLLILNLQPPSFQKQICTRDLCNFEGLLQNGQYCHYAFIRNLTKHSMVQTTSRSQGGNCILCNDFYNLPRKLDNYVFYCNTTPLIVCKEETSSRQAL